MPYTPHNKRDPDHKQKERREGSTQRRENWALGTAIVGVIVVAASVAVSAWNTTVVKGQMIVMEAQSRPWITAVPSYKYGLRIESGNKFNALINVHVKNVGNEPAIGILVGSHYIAATAKMSTLSPAEEWKKTMAAETAICDSLRVPGLSGPDRIGITLFPGEEADIPSGYSDPLVIPGGDIRVHSDKTRSANIIVVGCVDYQFYVSGTHHQTRFAYEVKWRDPKIFTADTTKLIGDENGTYYSDIPVGSLVPPGTARFVKYIWGNGYVD